MSGVGEVCGMTGKKTLKALMLLYLWLHVVFQEEAGEGQQMPCRREVGPSCTETQAYPVVCIVRKLCRIPEGTGYLNVQMGVELRANRLSTSAAHCRCMLGSSS
jgi:hypothetical protein